MTSPSLSNVSIYLLQADNWLRSMERDYKYDPAKIRLVIFPGALVAEIGRLQQKGFPYIFVPKQF